MGLYSQRRRHRLNPDETPIVMELVWSKLQTLCEAREDPVYAETLYRILYRFHHNSPGRPWYPDFCWRTVDDLLSSIDLFTTPDNDPLNDTCGSFEEVDV